MNQTISHYESLQKESARLQKDLEHMFKGDLMLDQLLSEGTTFDNTLEIRQLLNMDQLNLLYQIHNIRKQIRLLIN